MNAHIYYKVLALVFGLALFGGNPVHAEGFDLITTSPYAGQIALADSAAGKKGVLGWVKRYLQNTNKPTDKAFDISFLLGPSYTAATSLGLGATASGLYSWDRSDPTLPLSNVSLFGNASLSGMLVVGLRGNNFLPHNRYRLDYQLSLFTNPSYLWGLDYKQERNDDNKSKYECVNLLFKPEFMVRAAKNFYVGVSANLRWMNSYAHEKPELLGGQDPSVLSVGAGANLTYDSRDFVLNAYRGHYLRLEQLFYPSAFGNDHHFASTEFTYSTYRQVWKGGVLAMELHGLFNYGDVPWPMLAQVGQGGRMRGYYTGRYRDRHIVEGQLELRQHIKGRHGMVVFAGAANVFRHFEHMLLKQTLPNYGVGYRWEFKKRVNIRLDFGFTKDKPSMAFNINEAF